MKKIIILFILLLSNSINAANIDYSKTIGDFTLNFKSNNSSQIFNSEFSIFDSQKTLIHRTNFKNDETLKDFKFINSKNLLELSKNTNKLTAEINSEVLSIMDVFLDSVLKDLSVDTKNIAQLWFHYSILKINERYFANNVCECTVHPAYLIGKTNFSCIEDHKLVTNILKTEVSLNKEKYTDENSKRLISFLENYTDETIKFEEVYNYYYPISQYKKDIIANISGKSFGCILGTGSAHGCCGNYSGCCYYIHPVCYIHDAMCSDCKPKWFCLPGCRPD